MIKVFFTLTPAFNPNAGGVQRTTFKLGKFFTEKGLDVYYYSFANEGHIEVEYGRLFHDKQNGGCSSEANIKHLKECIRNTKPDIVINQMPYEVALRNALGELKEEVGYKLIGCLRNSLFSVKNNIGDFTKHVVPGRLTSLFNNKAGYKLLFYLHKRKHAAQLREILDKHDHFVLLAPPNKIELEYFVGNYNSHKVFSIPNSIPEVSDGVQNKEKILLYVGRLAPTQKKVELLLPVWQKIEKQLKDWRFIIVGEGEYEESIKREIIKKNISRVEIAGFQKPEKFYEKASLFIMTSAYEGFPNVILEAQSFAVVPVAFDSYPVLSWLVNDEEDALLCTPFNTYEMAEKILSIVSDQQKLKVMQEKALINASKFTIDKVGKTWLHFFQKIGKYHPVKENV